MPSSLLSPLLSCFPSFRGAVLFPLLSCLSPLFSSARFPSLVSLFRVDEEWGTGRACGQGWQERRAASGSGLDCLICGRVSLRFVCRISQVGMCLFVLGIGMFFAFFSPNWGGGGVVIWACFVLLTRLCYCGTLVLNNRLTD